MGDTKDHRYRTAYSYHRKMAPVRKFRRPRRKICSTESWSQETKKAERICSGACPTRFLTVALAKALSTRRRSTRKHLWAWPIFASLREIRSVGWASAHAGFVSCRVGSQPTRCLTVFISPPAHLVSLRFCAVSSSVSSKRRRTAAWLKACTPHGALPATSSDDDVPGSSDQEATSSLTRVLANSRFSAVMPHGAG